ncbi:mercury methylation corrinoid protein HgcA [Clostridium sp. BSD9I1]|uniref:mercury methylation corrinoid protein HgcA n=1 Tax=Clostridium sp. BSD9I1 TaxID=2003589 RepID=UPI001645BBA7|nr:mercury methylation corrinoid protein HgcA [Clostridium sp. BSD9I1]
MLKAKSIKGIRTCSCKNEIKITKVSSELTSSDIIGAWKARWGIKRMNFKVSPGLYSIGIPDNNSPVFVTANYKMSFDCLRKELKYINAYILVLDTKGINVWCAASKGTFSTNELVSRINKVNLSQIISHKTLILPQLGATGVSAHEVQKKSGFKVIYGPVRAEDIPEFLNNGLKSTKKMREVRFNFIDRIVLTPVEMVGSMKISLYIFGVMFLLNLLGLGSFSGIDAVSYIGAVLVGCVVVPMFLPWIPGKAFSLKGWLIGALWAVAVIFFSDSQNNLNSNLLKSTAYLLILPSVSAYYSMNFTGASTYTSFSGVLKEMRIAVPFILITVVMGIITLLVGNFIII